MRIFTLIISFLFSMEAFAFSPSDLRAFGGTAPVQLYLFTSLTCPHCADFHKEIFPQLKRKFADTGKAQIIIVDMVSNMNGLLATQTLRCLDMGASDKFENDLYTSQSKWMSKSATDAGRMIENFAAKQGMKQDQFNLCVTDIELKKNILEQQENLSRLYGVNGTPTLVMREGTEVRKWTGADKRILKELEESFQK